MSHSRPQNETNYDISFLVRKIFNAHQLKNEVCEVSVDGNQIILAFKAPNAGKPERMRDDLWYHAAAEILKKVNDSAHSGQSYGMIGWPSIYVALTASTDDFSNQLVEFVKQTQPTVLDELAESKKAIAAEKPKSPLANLNVIQEATNRAALSQQKVDTTEAQKSQSKRKCVIQ
ncbi:MAG: hypothetical protein P4M12_01995 [Gammaproteobacteria bacterium]|nr:hypothetical protein [Gammaproteobacteria bacterium]